MNDNFDEMIKQNLLKNAEPLPNSYTEQISALLSKLPQKVVGHKKNICLKYAVVALIIFSMMGSATYAAINAYQDHLTSMTLDEKEKLNDNTQKTTDNSDHFSRKLSKNELNKFEFYRKKYESEGIFPKNKIEETNKINKNSKDKVTFCYKNSTFYIPDREMTTEEILEIIDFWERRDYAVKENSKQNKTPDELQKISKKESIKIAETVLNKIYGLDTDSATSNVELNIAELSEKKHLSSYYVWFSDNLWDYDACVEINSDNGTINQVSISHKKKNKYVSGITVNESAYKTQVKEIYNILSCIDTKKTDISKIQLVYKFLKNNTLNRGNVKYYVELKDGTGYVFLYSVNTNMFYNFYKIYNYTNTLEQDKADDKLQEKNGVLTKSIVIMK